MSIESILFQTLTNMQSLDLPAGESTSGTKFENHVVTQLYQHLVQRPEYRVFPPRYTLHEPTFSGVFHQFDIVVVQQNLLSTIECKFRGSAHIDQLFATQGKISDYRSRPRCIFVTTSNDVNDEIYQYGLAHHIEIICRHLAPVAYMLQCVKKETDFAQALEVLHTRMKGEVEPKRLLIEWKHVYSRFKAEGYCEPHLFARTARAPARIS